jgi:hypothetical protein
VCGVYCQIAVFLPKQSIKDALPDGMEIIGATGVCGRCKEGGSGWFDPMTRRKRPLVADRRQRRQTLGSPPERWELGRAASCVSTVL